MRQGTEDGREHDARQSRPALGCRVVDYEDRPDRVTVFPERADDVARLSAWLTVDADVVVGLHAVR